MDVIRIVKSNELGQARRTGLVDLAKKERGKRCWDEGMKQEGSFSVTALDGEQSMAITLFLYCAVSWTDVIQEIHLQSSNKMHAE
jgi:hypothetical protein